MKINPPNQFWIDHSDWQAKEAQAARDEQRRHPRDYPLTRAEEAALFFSPETEPKAPNESENE